MLNKLVYIDIYVCLFCAALFFGDFSELAAKATALLPLAAVAA